MAREKPNLSQNDSKKATQPEISTRAGGVDPCTLGCIVDSFSDHVSIIDCDHNIVWANQTARRLFGSDLAGRKCYHAYHRRHVPCEPCVVAMAFADGRVHEHETEVIRADGQTMYFWCTASVAEWGAGGRPSLVVEISRDVTSRRRAEEELRAYALIVRSAQDAIFLKDLESRYLVANAKTLEGFGLSREQVIGKSDYEILGESDEARKNVEDDQAVFRTGKPKHLTKRMTDAHGHVYTFEAVKVPRFDAKGDVIGLVGIARDITERVALEEQLRHAQKMEVVGRLAGGIAHDFNNLLTPIVGCSEALRRELSSDDPLWIHADLIFSASDRAVDLSRQLLFFARRKEREFSPVDLHAVVDNVAELARHGLAKRISITVGKEAERAIVDGDAGQLQSALLNLALNGCDAMARGGALRLSTGVVRPDEAFCRSHELQPGEYVRISVEDTGAGMDAETLAHVFEPFFTTKEVGKGTGLGLSVAYTTIRMHGGAIQAESEPGAGTTFHVWLPLTDAPVRTQKSATPLAEPGDCTGHILVVDDEQVVSQYVSATLGRLGYTVTVYAHGEAALKYFRDHGHAVDLVLLDLVLPAPHGTRIFHAIREVDPQARILLCSGSGPTRESRALLDEGAVGFLAKPFDARELAATVAEALGKS